MERYIQPWTKMECEECGSTHEVTRASGKTFIGKIVCSDCEQYYRGYEDAENKYKNELKVNELIIVELYEALRLAREMMVCNNLELPKTFEVIDKALSFKSNPFASLPSSPFTCI